MQYSGKPVCPSFKHFASIGCISKSISSTCKSTPSVGTISRRGFGYLVIFHSLWDIHLLLRPCRRLSWLMIAPMSMKSRLENHTMLDRWQKFLLVYDGFT